MTPAGPIACKQVPQAGRGLLRANFITSLVACKNSGKEFKLSGEYEGAFMSNDSVDRRNFLKSVGALSAATSAMAAAKSSSKASGRVIGANDRINIGLIGCGGRGESDAMDFAAYGKKYNDACQIGAV